MRESHQQQRDSFGILLFMLLPAVGLLFAVLTPWLTQTSLTVVACLGAIMDAGIVGENGIRMLDYVRQVGGEGAELTEVPAPAGRRRPRPVLRTSLAATLGMRPLAWGSGSGADMLKPPAIARRSGDMGERRTDE